jgi:DNA-binding CsgD family transcriptional regulator
MGAGKSTLLDHIAAQLDHDGYHVLRAAGSPHLTAIPLAPFARLFPETTASLHELLARVWQRLESEASGRNLALIVDDAEHLDPVSAALLHQQAAFGTAVVVASMRSAGQAPEAIRALWKDGLCARLQIDPLTQEEVDRLLVLALGGRVEGFSVHQLHRLSGGNPLFLRELVRTELDAGTLAFKDSIWRWTGSLSRANALNELVWTRLSSLPDDVRSALEVIALAEPVDPELVADLTACDRIHAILEANELVRSVSERPHLVGLAHPIFGEVLRRSLSRRSSHQKLRALADAMERRGLRDRSELLQLAVWRAEVGGKGDSDLLLEAARWLGGSDDELAMRLVRRANEECANIDGRLLLARILTNAGRCTEASELLQKTVPASREDRRRLALTEAELVLCSLGDAAAALNILEVVDDERHPDLDGDIQSLRCRLHGRVGNVADLSGRAKGLLSRSDLSFAGRMWATTAALEGWLQTGQDADAPKVCGSVPVPRDGYPIEARSAVAQARLLQRRASAWSGRLGEALHEAQIDYELTLTTGDRLEHGYAALGVGELLLLSGRVDESIWLLREASISLQLSRVYMSACLAGLTTALALAGEVDLARAELASLDEEGALTSDYITIERARATIDWAGSHRDRAKARLRSLIPAVESSPAGIDLLQIAHELARLGDVRNAQFLLTRVRGSFPLGDLLVSHVDAMAGRRPHPLVEVANRLAEAGLLRFAAEAELEAADRFASEGQRAAASSAWRRASSLISLCGPLHLGIEPPFSGSVSLTRREREIANLAISGLRDQQISAQLELSVRTVQTHLHRVYCKLGVHSRQSLADVLQRESSDSAVK